MLRCALVTLTIAFCISQIATTPVTKKAGRPVTLEFRRAHVSKETLARLKAQREALAAEAEAEAAAINGKSTTTVEAINNGEKITTKIEGQTTSGDIITKTNEAETTTLQAEGNTLTETKESEKTTQTTTVSGDVVATAVEKNVAVRSETVDESVHVAVNTDTAN